MDVGPAKVGGWWEKILHPCEEQIIWQNQVKEASKTSLLPRLRKTKKDKALELSTGKEWVREM